MASPNFYTEFATDQQELVFRRKLADWANSAEPGEACVGDSWAPRACANCEIEYVRPDGIGRDVRVRAAASHHPQAAVFECLQRVLECNGCGATLRLLLLCEPVAEEPAPG